MHVFVVVAAVALGAALGWPLERVVSCLVAHRPLGRSGATSAACGDDAHAAVRVAPARTIRRHEASRGLRGAHDVALRRVVLGASAAAACGAVAARLGAVPALPAYLVFALGLVAMSATDLERRIIPRRLVHGTAAALGALLGAASWADGRPGALLVALGCGAVSFLVFFVVHLVSPRGLGFGDVRLGALVGAATGWISPERTAVAFLLAFGLGAVVGVAVMVASGQGRKATIPFGPFLAAGALGALVTGGALGHVLVALHG